MKNRKNCSEFKTVIKRKGLGISFCFLVVVLLWSMPINAFAQNTTTWKYYGITPPMHHDSVRLKEFAKDVKQLTNNQLQIVIYTGGELPYRPTEAISIVRDRFVDGATAVGDFIAGSVPIFNLTNLPMLITSESELNKAMKVFEPYAEKAFNKNGARILFWHFNSLKCIFGRGKPIESLNDIKGKKIRTFGVPDAEFIRKLGGIPVSMPNTEVATAMQRGVMDAFIASAFFTIGSRWDELCDWGYLTDMTAIMACEIVSIPSVKKLSANTQKILFDTAAKYHVRWHKEILELEQKSRASMANKGKKLIKMTAKDRMESMQIIKPYWEQWAKSVGPDAVEALDKVRNVLKK
jgi:TRAP-type C4-dicarboxylate transport system substrate-binding protein